MQRIMQQIFIEKKHIRNAKAIDAREVKMRTKEYECTRYCRICPYPGLKCCEEPDFDRLAK